MDDDFDLESDGSPMDSNESVDTNSILLLPSDSSTFIRSSSTDSISDTAYAEQLADRVRELKAELRTRCQLDWLSKFEPAQHNPKIELNLLLHGAIRERTLRQIAFSKGLDTDERMNLSDGEEYLSMITDIFQNDYCLLQRIFQEIVSDQRQRSIVYTEILFRPDVFKFDSKDSNITLSDVMKVIIDCIRFFTSIDDANTTTVLLGERKESHISSVTSLNIPVRNHALSDHQFALTRTITSNSHIVQYARRTITTPLPVHIKLVLSCDWANIKRMDEFIRLARSYPEEIVGIDFYGHEEDCVKYWQDFRKYTKTLRDDNLHCQASVNNYKNSQLIADIVKDLHIDRLSEAYTIATSSKYAQDLLMKHGVNLVLCPTSEVYVFANQQIASGQKRKHDSLRDTDQESPELNVKSFHLINYLQSELINFSITSLSSTQYHQNLVDIYANLFETNPNDFTCEHMQWINENGVKASFASQKIKIELIKCLRQNYADCYRQDLLRKKLQLTMNKWQEEMEIVIDKNAKSAAEFAWKMRQEKLLERARREQEIKTKVFDEETISDQLSTD